MSHPMKDARRFPVALDRPYGAVMVERKSLREKTVVVQPGVHARASGAFVTVRDNP